MRMHLLLLVGKQDSAQKPACGCGGLWHKTKRLPLNKPSVIKYTVVRRIRARVMTADYIRCMQCRGSSILATSMPVFGQPLTHRTTLQRTLQGTTLCTLLATREKAIVIPASSVWFHCPLALHICDTTVYWLTCGSN